MCSPSLSSASSFLFSSLVSLGGLFYDFLDFLSNFSKPVGIFLPPPFSSSSGGFCSLNFTTYVLMSVAGILTLDPTNFKDYDKSLCIVIN